MKLHCFFKCKQPKKFRREAGPLALKTLRKVKAKTSVWCVELGTEKALLRSHEVTSVKAENRSRTEVMSVNGENRSRMVVNGRLDWNFLQPYFP